MTESQKQSMTAAMPNSPFTMTQKSLFYAAKTLLGSAICWYGLIACGIDDPLWGVISVIIVSDADLTGTASLAKVRVINTAVGCAAGLVSLLLFGYSPLGCLLTAAATVLLVTSLQYYPANWRLAPVTVIIVMMDTARPEDAGKHETIYYALMRAVEISVGCAVALVLAYAFTRIANFPLFSPKKQS